MGPLAGLKIIEISGLGPGPFAGMMLADMGAEVILVERRIDSSKTRIPDCNRRGKKSIAINLKDPEGVETLDIWRGAIPFIGLQLSMIALVTAIPALATWLPSVLE